MVIPYGMVCTDAAAVSSGMLVPCQEQQGSSTSEVFPPVGWGALLHASCWRKPRGTMMMFWAGGVKISIHEYDIVAVCFLIVMNMFSFAASLWHYDFLR